MAPENISNGDTFANPFSSGPFGAPPASPEEPDTAAAAANDQTPAGAAFGLVFQAPEPTRRPPRRVEREAPVEEDSNDVDSDAEDETDDEGTTPRRRRRGGRGRRGKAGEGESSGEDQADEDNRGGKKPAAGSSRQGGSQPDAEDAKGGAKNDGKSGSKSGDDASRGSNDGANDQDSSDDSDGGSRKRTRRRRRNGAGGSDSDEPGTVTKVREPRKAKDEVTSIKGSTRLEAKKQRRREGREAGRRRTVVTEAEFLARRESVERVMVVREQEGRTQIGVLEDGVLAEHYVSRDEQASSMAGNVYLGRVQNVLPSMEAAFIDIGRGRNAVLYAGEVNWDAAGLDKQPKRIEKALKAGESVLVQVTKDPIGHKGARLTSQISLPGRFLVYVPGNSMTGISRKLPDTERARLKKILKEVVPAEAGVIVRTAAEGASEEELRADVERLTKMWESIQKKAEKGNAPSLLHGEPDLTVRVIRDVFNEDFAKMIVSGDKAWDEVHGYISDVAPDLRERLQKWAEERDVFAKYRIDEQLAKAMDRKVWLPSGGSLVIDRTEAMTVVDVNTGKFIGSGGNLEETVTKNNIEAAEEIVRQLRLRDIGGIIVVDFIDMVLESNRELVVRRLLECLGRDRTKHQVAEVTSLGLVQMTRKRVGSGLVEVFSEPCEACQGRGIIIHDHPVENRDINGEDTNSKRGRGGRRGGRDQGGRSAGSQKNDAPEPQETKDNGFAQIAAAAHAAAVAKGEKPAGADQPGVEGAVKAAPVRSGRVKRPSERAAEAERATSTMTVAGPAAAPVSAVEPAPEPKAAPKRRGSRRAAASSGAPTTAGQAQVMSVHAGGESAAEAGSVKASESVGQGASSEGAAASAASASTESATTKDAVSTNEPAAPAKAKRSRRAASSVGAPVTLQPVDLSGAGTAAAPLTKPAGRGGTTSSSASAGAGEAETAAAPTRKKRARVVAPAGSPTAVPDAD